MIGRLRRGSARAAAALTTAALVLSMAAAAPAAAQAARDDETTFTGADGATYPRSPMTVHGLDGELFLGPDFDVACALGTDYTDALRTFAGVARVISRSGRRVVFTAAPNKSSVFPELVDPAAYPHGRCGRRGVAAGIKALQRFDDPDFLPLLEPLRRSRHQVFWKTDPHWSSVGGSVFAKQLAHHLDPRLGRLQRYRYGTETGLGMLNAEQGISTTETLETASPKTPVSVRTGRGCDPWAGYPTLIYETCWVSSPAKRTWPGRTLLLGDSFMMYALQSLQPLFRQGRFMWVGHADRDVAAQVQRSDTVVMEVAQLFVPGSVITTRSFKRALQRRLS